MRTLYMLVSLTLAISVVGCGASAKQKTKNQLQQVGLAYHEFFSVEKRAPASLEELSEFLSKGQVNRPMLDEAIAAIRAGDFVIIWNAALKADGNANDQFVLGYVKSAKTEGGLTLMGGGFVKDLTADEFASQKMIATANK